MGIYGLGYLSQVPVLHIGDDLINGGRGVLDVQVLVNGQSSIIYGRPPDHNPTSLDLVGIGIKLRTTFMAVALGC